MEAVAYVRVSTEDQAQEGVSLAAQRSKLRAWCDLHDHDLITIHEDAGISGASAEKRPGLQAALNEACRKKAVLLVFSLSRLARSTMDALLISERLERAGADLVSLSEKIDTTTAAGRSCLVMYTVSPRLALLRTRPKLFCASVAVNSLESRSVPRVPLLPAPATPIRTSP